MPEEQLKRFRQNDPNETNANNGEDDSLVLPQTTPSGFRKFQRGTKSKWPLLWVEIEGDLIYILANGVNPADVLEAMEKGEVGGIRLGETNNELVTKARRDWLEAEGIEWAKLDIDILRDMELLTLNEWRQLKGL